MLDIYVDADACPVKDEVVQVALRHGLTTIFVGNRWVRGADHSSIRRVVVGEGFDAADDWLAEHIGERDIAVTADIPLAARCLEKGARVIGPSGRPFGRDSIGMALAMRELNAQLRDMGVISGGGPSFSRQDRSRFLSALEQTIQAIRRGR